MGLRDRDDLGPQKPAVLDPQQADGAAGLAAAVGGRARVEDAQAVARLVQRDVRVPEHDQVSGWEAAAHPAQPAGRRTAVVQHGHAQPAEVELGDVGRTPGGHVGSVVVAADRAHRRVPGQLVQHRRGAHVTGVQDEVGPAQMPRHPGRARLPPARRVRVRKDNYPAGHDSTVSSRTASRGASGGRYDLAMLARKPGKPTRLFEPWFAPFALINGSAVGLTPILLPLVAAKQGAGHVGLVMGAFNLGAFAAPITGGIADSWHAHRFLATLCAAMSAVSLWLFAFADSPLQLLLALVNGAGFAGAVTIANLLIVERRPESEWNQRLGWLETALSIGQGGALILAAWLSTLSERTGLSIAALIPAAAIPLSLMMLPRLADKPASAPAPGTVASTASTHRLSNGGHTGEWGPVSPSGLPHVPGRRPSVTSVKRAVGLLRGGFGWMMAAWIPAYAGSAIVFSLYPVLFQHAFGVQPQTSSLAFA